MWNRIVSEYRLRCGFQCPDPTGTPIIRARPSGRKADHAPDVLWRRPADAQVPQTRRQSRFGKLTTTGVKNQAVVVISRLGQVEQSL
jgi:hypothetical protein